MNLHQKSIAPTHTCSETWEKMTREEKWGLIQSILIKDEQLSRILSIADLRVGGQVIVKFLEPVGADKRGQILLDLEYRLKEEGDLGLNVWLEPLGDKSVLRKLRGIEVKNS